PRSARTMLPATVAPSAATRTPAVAMGLIHFMCTLLGCDPLRTLWGAARESVAEVLRPIRAYSRAHHASPRPREGGAAGSRPVAEPSAQRRATPAAPSTGRETPLTNLASSLWRNRAA